MIIAYTGMPGGGKTTALAWRAMKAMEKGQLVFSNVNIKGAYKIDLDDLVTYRFPEGCTVIIDEAGRWFNSHNWKDLPPEVFDMFTMHRHMRMDLYIGVQSFARIDKSLREVIELTYWSRNPMILPWHKYEGFYDLEKVGSMRREHDASHIVWKSRKVRSMFNTHSMKSKFAHKDEIPLVSWETFNHANKKFAARFGQKIRVTCKLVIRPYLHKTKRRRKDNQDKEQNPV